MSYRLNSEDAEAQNTLRRGLSQIRIVVLISLTFALSSCSYFGLGADRTTKPTQNTTSHRESNRPRSENVFDEYLTADIPPADGFDFPFGDGEGQGSYQDPTTGKTHNGWYVATNFADVYSLGIHPGEDWNGSGGGNTDLGQPVYAVANGQVVFAGSCGRLWGNVIVIEHLFYENHEKKRIRSVYAHLNEIKIQAGGEVKRRQLIGTVGQDPDKLFNAHLHLELRWDLSLAPDYWPTSNGRDVAWVKEHYTDPSEFITQHRKLFVPHDEAALVLVDQDSYRMRLYKRGQAQDEHEVSFGQGKGPKRVEGDNKTPVGMYFVVQKHRGSFDGPYGAYYGGHWIKINYPNTLDALRGRADQIITSSQEEAIRKTWSKRELTPQNTKLGGGIGFHGWNREWSNDGPRHLSWGCVVLHLSEISTFYDRIPEGSMVVIF